MSLRDGFAADKNPALHRVVRNPVKEEKGRS